MGNTSTVPWKIGKVLPGLAATIAAALSAPDPARPWDYGFAVSEQKEVTGCLVKLQTALKTEAVRTVQRLHIETLATQSLKPWWNYFKAEELAIKSLRQLAPINALPACATSVQTKWHLRYFHIKPMKLNACRPMLLWIKCNTSAKKFPILSVVEQATKYTVATLLHGEKGDDLIRGLERAWIRHFGLPRLLSHRLSLVERRHVTLRHAIELYTWMT